MVCDKDCVPLIPAVVGHLVTPKNVLLAIKRRKIGRGFLMPYGGKYEPDIDASLKDAMVRELDQEAEVRTDIDNLEERGFLFAENYKMGTLRSRWKIGIYLIHRWTGVPTDTEEMRDATWYPRSKHGLPFCRMLAADRVWLPMVLSGKYVRITAAYNLEDMSLRRPLDIWSIDRPLWKN